MKRMSEILWKNNHEGDITAFEDFFYDNINLVTSLKLVQQFGGHKSFVPTASINSYGDKLITSCDLGFILLWDIGTRLSKPQSIIKPNCQRILTTNFLSSNKFIAGGNDATVQLIELNQTGIVSTLYENHHKGKVISSIIIDPNTFITCSDDNSLHLFDIRQNYPSSSFIDVPLVPESYIDVVRKEVESRKDPPTVIPKITPNQEIHTESLLLNYSEGDPHILSMDVHPIDKKRFAVSRDDGTIILLDLRKMDPSKQYGFSVREAYNKQVGISHLAFDEYGERIAASVHGGSVHLFETSENYEIFPSKIENKDDLSDKKYNIRISDYVSDDGNIDLVNLREAIKNRPEMPQPHKKETVKEAPGCIKVLNSHICLDSPSPVRWFGNFVATGSDDALVYLYDANDGNVKKVLSGHHGHVESIISHREKKFLVTCGMDDFAQMWSPMACTDIDIAANEMEVREALQKNKSDEGYMNANQCNVM
ncbi:hypothetical protein TVAG_361460 [Trichomonas vaginalis G3]|uniref:WD repeat protein n=1 Tax=Trichomonas vaginalis (strain ATCC PRA-98 / G3) TaxID=412133 RepID=A2FZR3_TRIV3|nr:protein modification by small protein conjugation or removal [Trichomonas vaginalis G3]EAX89603.1 hypothetical protein TVAG_361460 [Trichomonas vaginalis G3]KAI5512105.1 protein modification by small protein conjugation or removal [Trichomonas vaginalis G3]|eukprot:XP_001302533.1 hypothetical protein [Trichomonas vaginalis G3]